MGRILRTDHRRHALALAVTALAALTLTARPALSAPDAGPTPAPSPAQTWAFQPDTDTFGPDALLDLRSLNEKVAGQSGFVRRTLDGADFALGDGRPVRFWAMGEGIGDTGDKAVVAHKARWLAKRGVNMVRVAATLTSDEEGKPMGVKTTELEHVWSVVTAMKREGIYTTLIPYWSVPVKIRDSWHIPGGAGQSALGLLFWDPTLQAVYKDWLRALFTRPNPETGVPLSKEPAIAVIEIQNEDSMLFWTMQGIKGPQLGEVRALFGAWLTKKYGSLAKAQAAWGGGAAPPAGDFQDNQGDEPVDGKMGIYIVYHLTVPQTGYRSKRVADQIAFFSETMRDFNAEMARFLRHDLGCRQLINADNWRPADPVHLYDAERYAYTANDVMAVNRYFGGQHDGPDAGWAIRVGDHFTNASVLHDPRGLPTNIKQPVGQPFVITETEWVAPDLYQSEGSFLIAAYESLTGVDYACFSSDGTVPEWQPPFLPLIGAWQPPTGKWNIGTPMQLGQFPAAALMYRKGYLKRGRVAVHEERALSDIWQRRSTLISEEGGYDPNRDAGDLPSRSAVKSGVDPLAFLVGPVEVKYGGDPAKSAVINLKPYLNAAHQTVTSDTGEERFHYGAGVCTVNAPRAQGATGFLKAAGPLRLADITLVSGDEYGSVLAVPLDGLPLRSSRKILVQIGTTARPTGWQDKDATWTSADGKQTFTGKEVVSVGQNPWQIADTAMTLTIRNPLLTTARALDANFRPLRPVPLTHRGGACRLALPPDALYVVLEAPAPRRD